MSVWILILLSVFAMLQAGDVATTVIALSQGKREANPVAAWLMRRLTIPWAMALKLVVTISAGIFAAIEAPLLLAVFTALYTWVVWHNYRQIR